MALLSYSTAYTELDSCFGVYDIDSDLEYEWIVTGMGGNNDQMIVTGNTLEFYSPIDSEIFIDLNIYEIHSLDVDGDGILDDVQENILHGSVQPYMLVADVYGCDGDQAEYDMCDVCSGCGLLDWYYDNDSDCSYGEYAGELCSNLGEESEYELADFEGMITDNECFVGECYTDEEYSFEEDGDDNYYCDSNVIDECGQCDGCLSCESTLGDGNLDQVVDIMDIMVVIDYLFNDLEVNELPEDDLDCLESSIYVDGCDGSLDPLGDFDQDYSLFIGENNVQFENINVAGSDACNDHCSGCIDILDIVGVVEIIFDDNLSRDFADNVSLIKDVNELRLEADGDVSLHLVLNHELDFDFTITDQGFMQNYKTNGTRTDIILLMPDNGIILSSMDTFEVLEIMAATDGGYIDVDYDVIPNEFILEDVYPNPFNPVTNITYSLPISSEISIRIFDIQGREVDILYDNIQDAGSHMLVWDASNFATGIYFVRMSSSSFTGMKKLMLIK
jgi:hypothetical protein